MPFIPPQVPIGDTSGLIEMHSGKSDRLTLKPGVRLVPVGRKGKDDYAPTFNS